MSTREPPKMTKIHSRLTEKTARRRFAVVAGLFPQSIFFYETNDTIKTDFISLPQLALDSQAHIKSLVGCLLVDKNQDVLIIYCSNYSIILIALKNGIQKECIL